jgi:PPOX class probable F420-dependent enzyme
MIMEPPHEEFLMKHRFGVLTTIKKSGAPQSTAVYYLYENGKILISANKWKQKTLNIQRDPRVTFCAMDEDPANRYLSVSGRAAVTEDDLVETSTRIFRRFRSEIREDFPQWLKEQQRVILVLTPEQAWPHAVGRGGAVTPHKEFHNRK